MHTEKYYKWTTNACFIHSVMNMLVYFKCTETVRIRKDKVTLLQDQDVRMLAVPLHITFGSKFFPLSIKILQLLHCRSCTVVGVEKFSQ